MIKLSFKSDKGRILFTSDLHWGHSKDFILKPRNYGSLQEALEHARGEIYNMLQPDDILFNLGDVAIGAGEQNIVYAREVVNFPCKHQYFIWGNHNSGMETIYNEALTNIGGTPGQVEVYPLTTENGRFTFLGHYAELYIDGIPVVIAHYPMASWNHMSKNGFMIHGHCHRNLKDDPTLKRLDVGWDWKRRLVTWEEINRELRPRKTKAVDHHGAE